MKRVMTLLAILTTAVFSSAQNDNGRYGYDNILFSYEIRQMDSVIFVDKIANQPTTAICVEKKNLLKFVDKDSSFYNYWEVLPDAFRFLDPDWFPFIFHYVIPSISDTAVVSTIRKQYFENGLCKVGYSDLWGGTRRERIPFHNLTYSYLNCNHYLVLLMPYKFYDEHVEYLCILDYDTPTKRHSQTALLKTPFAEGFYIKLLLPLFYYQDSANKNVSE